MEFESLVIGIHYFACIFLIIVILLQAGKGADAGAALGAGSSGTVFGPRGAATFLSKMTTAVAVIFLLTSMTLASFSKKQAKSVIKPGVESIQEETQPTEMKPSDPNLVKDKTESQPK